MAIGTRAIIIEMLLFAAANVTVTVKMSKQFQWNSLEHENIIFSDF